MCTLHPVMVGGRVGPQPRVLSLNRELIPPPHEPPQHQRWAAGQQPAQFSLPLTLTHLHTCTLPYFHPTEGASNQSCSFGDHLSGGVLLRPKVGTDLSTHEHTLTKPLSFLPRACSELAPAAPPTPCSPSHTLQPVCLWGAAFCAVPSLGLLAPDGQPAPGLEAFQTWSKTSVLQENRRDPIPYHLGQRKSIHGKKTASLMFAKGVIISPRAYI